MYVTLVQVHVLLPNIQEFITATRANHTHSVKEPGNLRFDVLQSADDPARFVLYEAYVSTEAAAAHKRTSHYLTWRDAVAPWMAAPRIGAPYVSLLPD